MAVIIEKFDRQDLFKEKLFKGINLFTGAGFSCLADEDGNKLPLADELCKEICNRFELSYDVFGSDLETVCAIAQGDELQELLRKKFSVEKINEKYLLLNKIKILAYVTTNIDNIIHLAIESENKYYLKSLTYYGAVRKECSEVCYIPLHGEVMNHEKALYFGKFDLATADQANSDLFQQATIQLRDKPTLFWGYGFHDSGVLKMIQKLLTYGPQDIWVQCRPTDIKQIKLFESLGCNVIVADTLRLFEWIEENTTEEISDKEIKGLGNNLKRFFIPTINQVPAVPAEDYFIKGMTQWYSVLTKQAIEMDMVNDTYNTYLNNKNIVIIGTNFSGKTTILMQLALKINSKNKLFVNNLTPELSTFIINNLVGTEATIFVDDCELDMIAYKMLAQAENIKTIATATDYSYEAAKHLLEGLTVKQVFIDDFSQDQARRFYNAIDKTLRQSIFSYKENDVERFSILEMMLKNINNSLKEDRILQVLLKVLKSNESAFETVALAIYLSGNNSALSTDILYSYFNCSSYEETKKYVNEANGLLRDLDVAVDKCYDDQDYYDVRSKLFLYHAKALLEGKDELKSSYAKVIDNVLKNIWPYKIYRYDQFRRSAYDAKLFYTLFDKKANVIYEKLYEYDSNPYNLQQWALCRAYLGEYKEAFSSIDKALRQKPNNFSIKNTSAIILFEANKKEKNETGRAKRKEAMSILEKCYSNDKRKSYHANKFAEFAIEILKMDKDPQYIEQASIWINEIIEKGDGGSRYTKKYVKQLNAIKEKNYAL